MMGPWQHPSPLFVCPLFWAHKGLLTICCCSDLLGRGLELADMLQPTHLGTMEHPAGRLAYPCAPLPSQSPFNWATSIPSAASQRNYLLLSTHALLAEQEVLGEGLTRGGCQRTEVESSISPRGQTPCPVLIGVCLAKGLSSPQWHWCGPTCGPVLTSSQDRQVPRL